MHTKKHLAFVFFSIFFVALWIGVDFIGTEAIAQKEFSFSVLTDLLIPAVIGTAIGYFLFMFGKYSVKKR